MKIIGFDREATPSKQYFRRGPFLAEVTSDGGQYRFAIRDEKGVSPTIHGTKKSLRETESAIERMLDRLYPEQRAA